MILDTQTVAERRRYPRAEVNWPVVILTNHGATLGETKNVGASGAFIFCRALLQPKDRFRVFMMPPDRQPLSIFVEVVWSNPHSSEEDVPPCGLGVRFRKISDADREFLRNVVKENYAKERLSEWLTENEKVVP
jgi:hypothetical protein